MVRSRGGADGSPLHERLRFLFSLFGDDEREFRGRVSGAGHYDGSFPILKFAGGAARRLEGAGVSLLLDWPGDLRVLGGLVGRLS